VTTRELLSVLQYIGLPATTVVVGGPADDHYCVQQLADGTWEVYFYDRGTKIKRVVLPDENTACTYLFGLLSFNQVMSRKIFASGH
jgi:hypothetical protein